MLWLVGEKITLVANPHTQTILRVENAFGDDFSQAYLIDRIKNTHRMRQRPHHEEKTTTQPSESMVETIHQEYISRCALPSNEGEN